MNLPSEQEFMKMTHFPFLEGRCIEYKKGFSQLRTQKVIETICAFLNTEGGFIIFGVEDETHKICGFEGTQKDLDNFILHVDSIIHQPCIISTNKLPITINNLGLKVIDTKSGKIIVLEVKPEKDTRYMLKDGSVYFRLNASNYKVNNIEYYSKSQTFQMVENAKKEVHNQYEKLINDLYNKIRVNHAKIHKKQKEIDESLLLLHNKILNDKKIFEEQNKKKYFFCNLF